MKADFVDEIVDQRTESNPAFPEIVAQAEIRRLKTINADLIAALEAMVKATDAYSVHGEDCSRTEECDEARDNPSDCAPHGCLDSKEDDCPSCECGITAIVLANEAARAVIARARGKS